MKLPAFLLRRKEQALFAPRHDALIGGGAKPVNDVDPWLIWTALTLLLFGLVMVYSSSIAYADGFRYTNHEASFFLLRHSVFLGMGVIGGFVVFQFPLRTWQSIAPWLFIVTVVLLIVVLIPHVGRAVNGAQRWLPLGIINLQPSEVMKFAAVLYVADYTSRKLADMGSFQKGFMPLALVIMFVGFLLLREPDFGAFVIVAVIAFGILFFGGINSRLFVLLSIVAILGLAALVAFSEYRRERVLGFMDPWQDAFGKGYQLSHALIAFGRGEWFGVGLGASVEKLFYLPEAHTDFLLAVIAEELGFVGVFCVIALFAVLVQRAFVIGRQALLQDRVYGGLTALGVGLWLGVQAIINMGVNMGLLPTKGLTLPLMSFGGSGLIMNCAALALLLRVDYENRVLRQGGQV